MDGSSKTTRRRFLQAGTGMAFGAPLNSTGSSNRRRDSYRLFSEGRIGGLLLKNRFIKAATAEGASVAGEMTEEGINIYRAVARGGVGLIITGGMAVVPSGLAGQKLAWIFDDRFIGSIEKIAKAVHTVEHSCKVIAQICHLGVQGDQSVSASAKLWPWNARESYALSVKELNSVIAQHAEGARRVREAGFDGVQIEAAHGYLLSSFLSPYTNLRTDRYGGSVRGRATILSEIIIRTRVLVGPDFPILVKINCDDHVEGGIDITGFPELAMEVEKTGVQAIEVSGNKSSKHPVSTPDEESYYLKHVEECHLGIPVILTGGNRSVSRLEKILARGGADFFGLARPLIREPDLPNRWLEGRGGPGSACVSCSRCLAGLHKGQVIHCRVDETDD